MASQKYHFHSIVFLIGFMGVVSFAQSAEYQVKNLRSCLNLQATASVRAMSLDCLKTGAVVEATGSPQGPWLPVRSGSHHGYVWMSYVRPLENSREAQRNSDSFSGSSISMKGASPSTASSSGAARLADSASSAGVPSAAPTFKVDAGESCAMSRTKPHGSAMDCLSSGTALEPINDGTSADGYTKVRAGNQTGYVHNSLIQASPNPNLSGGGGSYSSSPGIDSGTLNGIGSAISNAFNRSSEKKDDEASLGQNALQDSLNKSPTAEGSDSSNTSAPLGRRMSQRVQSRVEDNEEPVDPISNLINARNSGNGLSCQMNNQESCSEARLQFAPISNNYFSQIGNTSARRKAFISWMKPVALYVQATTGLPAATMISQAALETNWGTSSLFRSANAIFGHSCFTRGVSTQRADVNLGGKTFTWQGDCNRYRPANEGGRYLTFRSREDSVLAYVHLLLQKKPTAFASVRNEINRGLASSQGMPDARRTIRLIAASGYAADGSYNSSLNYILNTNNVESMAKNSCQTCMAALRQNSNMNVASLADGKK